MPSINDCRIIMNHNEIRSDSNVVIYYLATSQFLDIIISRLPSTTFAIICRKRFLGAPISDIINNFVSDLIGAYGQSSIHRHAWRQCNSRSKHCSHGYRIYDVPWSVNIMVIGREVHISSHTRTKSARSSY